MVIKSTNKASAILMDKRISRIKVGIGTTIISTTATIAITMIKSVDLLNAAPTPACVLASVAKVNYLRYQDEEYMYHLKYYYPLFCHFLQVLFSLLPDIQKQVLPLQPGINQGVPTIPPPA